MINCWEYKKCNKEKECPAGTLHAANGFCGGKNAGRGCVYVTGTYCLDSIQGTFKDKEKECTSCDFYKILRKEGKNEFSVLAFARYVRQRSNHAEIPVVYE